MAGQRRVARKAKDSTVTARRRAAAQKAADKAAAVAKRAKATGNLQRGRGALPAHQRVLRDSAIVSRALAGVEHKLIAEEFSVSLRTVERTISQFQAAPSPVDKQPMVYVEEFLRKYRAWIGDFEALAVHYAVDNPQAAIAAKRQARETLTDYWMLLVELGKLPRDLHLFRSEGEMLEVGRRMRHALERLAAGEIEAEEAVRLWDALMSPQTPLWDAESDAESEAGELEPGEAA